MDPESQPLFQVPEASETFDLPESATGVRSIRLGRSNDQCNDTASVPCSGQRDLPLGASSRAAGGPQLSARYHPKPQHQLSNSEKKGENVTTPEVSSPRPHPGRLAHLEQEPESTPGLLW